MITFKDNIEKIEDLLKREPQKNKVSFLFLTLERVFTKTFKSEFPDEVEEMIDDIEDSLDNLSFDNKRRVLFEMIDKYYPKPS